MGSHINRRAFIGGGLATGIAAAARPLRAASPAFERAFAEFSAPAAPPAAPIAATPSGLTPYQRHIITIARRERDRVSAALTNRELVAVADYALPSSQPRLHFVDLAGGKVESFLVAHGRGSDPEHDGWLKNFSNVPGSEATSRGAYVTAEQYPGKYGTAMRVIGLDADNSNAYERAIVMHPAWYAAPDMLARFGKLGRSEGCFAMAPENFGAALARLPAGHLLYADRIGDA